MATLFDRVHALLQYQATKMLYFLIYSRRLVNWWWSLVLFSVFLYRYWAFNLPGTRGSAFCFLFSGDCLDDSLFNSVTSNLQTNCAYSSFSLLHFQVNCSRIMWTNYRVAFVSCINWIRSQYTSVNNENSLNHLFRKWIRSVLWIKKINWSHWKQRMLISFFLSHKLSDVNLWARTSKNLVPMLTSVYI